MSHLPSRRHTSLLRTAVGRHERPVYGDPTLWIILLAGLLSGGCDLVDPPNTSPRSSGEQECLIPESEIHEGCQGKDCIRSLDNPDLVPHERVTYLRDSSRVIGLTIGDTTLAVAHNVLRWHEVANFDFTERRIAITYCPLTGSALAFDRSAVNGRTFGVSGLLYKNNLIMYDRTTKERNESLWTQMRMIGECGPETGTRLPIVETKEMEWARWNALHPQSLVVSDDEGSTGQYRHNDYRAYEEEDNPRVPFPLPDGMDERRPPKERVLGVPIGPRAGTAYPFGELSRAAEEGVAAFTDAVGGRELAVFWDTDAASADVFAAEHGGQVLEFTVRGGRIVDRGTGSTWTIEGEAVDGPLAGTRLEPITEAYVAFWFAWAAFQPETEIWNAVE